MSRVRVANSSLTGEESPTEGGASSSAGGLFPRGGGAPHSSNTPMVLYEEKMVNKRKGRLGKSNHKQHHQEVFEENEKEREGTDFFGGFGITKNEMMFQKWVKKSIDMRGIDFNQIDSLEVKANEGVYVSPEQLNMLNIYFRMCYLSTKSATDNKIRDQYELLCRRYDANTPYELATIIHGKQKARDILKKEEEYFQNVSSTENMKEHFQEE
jgi:hypothetical protein